MKKNFASLSIAAVSLLASALNTTSAPAQRNHVIQQPPWVLHIDCDRLNQTALGQFLLSHLDKPEAQARLAIFQAIFNLDPRKNIHGVTLYGAGPKPEDAIALIYGDFDSQRLLTLAQTTRDFKSIQHGQRIIYHWIDEKKPAKQGVKPRVYAAIYGVNLVIFGQKSESVALSLDVLDGTAPNLGSSALFGRWGGIGETAVIQAAAQWTDQPASKPSAQLLQQSKTAAFNLNETQNQVAADLSMDAADEEVARQMASVCQGIISLMSLQKDKPESVKLAQALSVSQNGSFVKVDLSMSSDNVIQILKAEEARKAAK